MLTPYTILILVASLLCCGKLHAQKDIDSSLEVLKEIPAKYIASIDKKIDKYTDRVSSRTMKTLAKLSRWETKVKVSLEKLNPEAANKLFGNNQLTFTSLLQKIKAGESTTLQYRQQYDKYRDDLTTSIKYLDKQKELLDEKLVKKLKTAKQKIQELNASEDNTDAIQEFIKQRKKELISTAFQYMGNSKYLSKINKEAWYYAETMRNYKQLFNDEEKLQQTVKGVLNKIPAFQQFIKQNSMLAGLFDIPSGDALLLPGMQTRTSVQELIQGRISAMGPNAQQLVSQNLEAAHSQINKLQDDIIKKSLANGGAGFGEMPNFKPNTQKTKTLRQRIEYSFNMQFSKSNNLIPPGTDMALSVGYKLNDKSIVGVGASYKLGIGTIDRIRFTNEGLGLRSFVDWKLKKQFYLSGGFEMNYNDHFKDGSPLGQKSSSWQKSALLGLTKKLSLKSKWFKTTNMQLLYDFLSQEHIPVSQSFIVRIGYGF